MTEDLATSSGGWAAEQLTAYLSALGDAGEREAIIEQALDLAADALECEVAGLLDGTELLGLLGFPGDGPVAPLLAHAVHDRQGTLVLPGLGMCRLLVATVDPEGSPLQLFVARADAWGFTPEERNLFRGFSRVLSMSLRSARILEKERTIRARSEAQAAENASLLRTVRERQDLLERLARIQRSITAGVDLDEVLRAVAQGAQELLGVDLVTLRMVEPDDPQHALLVLGVGDIDVSTTMHRVPLGTRPSGRCITEDRLVVLYDAPHNMEGHTQPGERLPYAVMAAPMHENGKPVGALVIGSYDETRSYSRTEQDILVSFADHGSLAIANARAAEALNRALHHARHEALHDVLTQLPNRALLRQRLDHAWSVARRRKTLLALLFLDLDSFKGINDSLGHEIGDQLLVEVAERLSDCLRPSDTIARLGGDEFAVLVEDLTSVGDVEEVATRLQRALAQPFTIAAREMQPTASIGIALADDMGDSSSLLRNADLAMYEAKRMGGGCFVRFQPDMHQRTLARLETEQDLRKGIVANELMLDYQPIFDLRTWRLSGVEALVRWRHPVRGLVSPAEFIPVAESSQLINRLGEWVLRHACAEAATWVDPVEVAVNLSPRQIDWKLPDLVADILADTGLAPGRLGLEVTEGAVMADSPDVLEILGEVQRTGVRFAIDDFGTGFSSLSRLRSLPVNMLKIDRTFVDALQDNNEQDIAVTAAIISLARGTGLATVAEGVETVEQLRTLVSLGCEHAQGFLLGRPGAPEKLRCSGSYQPLSTGDLRDGPVGAFIAEFAALASID